MYICLSINFHTKTIGLKLYALLTLMVKMEKQFMNKDLPVGKLFPPLRKYGKNFIETRTRSNIINHGLSSINETLLKH